MMHDKFQEIVILVVENNTDLRYFIRKTLEPSFSVVEAANGREGIQTAKEINPDIIICDMMRGADGYELCSVLKKDKNTCHIPIILLTAAASEKSIVEGLENGADDYITKPFNPKILLGRVKILLDLRSQQRLKIQREMLLQPTEITMSSVDKAFIKEIQDLIEKNLSDPGFNREKLGEKLCLSPTVLQRKIQALIGEPPDRFIRSYRIKRAAQLLESNFGNVQQVAAAVGFTSTDHFIECFKEEFHQLPSVFQVSEAK